MRRRASINVETLEGRRLLAAATVIPRIDDPIAVRAPTLTRTDVESGSLIGLDAMRADPRFADLDGRGYSVVVIDTAIDLDSPYFGADLDGNGVADRIVYSYDFSEGNDADASGTDDHGSNVASIAVGEGNKLASHAGMAPGANLIFLKVFAGTGGGTATTEDVNEALAWVVANAQAYNVVSVNLSLGYGNFSSVNNSEGAGYFSQFVAGNIIPVASAGNAFYTYGSAQGVSNFAADPNVLAVGAVFDDVLGRLDWSNGAIDYSTARDRVTSFSQRSTTLTSIFAPGGAISGASASGGTSVMFGTSQAAPHVAGIVALAQQLAVRTIGRRLTFNEFGAMLKSSGVAIRDGDDEDDNVANTNADFKRVDVYALAKAIAALATPPTSSTPTLLSGTPFGTSGSFAGSGNTIARAFDGDLATFVDLPAANGAIVGLDLGSPQSIGSVKFAPRGGWANRMVGGVFQASNDAGFATSVTLGTIVATPPTGALTTLTFAPTSATYRYVRYVAPASSYGNVAELQFFTPGAAPAGAPVKLTGTAIGTSGSFNNSGNTIAKALDGDFNSFFDGPIANGNWVGLDLGAATTIAQVAYASRGGWSGRMNGGVFQASNDASFATAVTLFTIPSNANPPSGALTTQPVTATGSYRYVRYLAPANSYGNVAEVQFFTTSASTPPPPAPSPVKLTGATIGTPGSFNNSGNTIAKAVDGDLASYYDGAGGNNNWVGLDLGAATVIKQVAYAPRGGWAGRMVGGIFQGSNDASFASATTLFTVTTAPTAGALTTASVSVTTAFRYVRYLAPANSYGNVAEIAFYG